jgi:aspT/yidE/ybjL antiporter duplication domain
MSWFVELWTGSSIPHTIVVLAVVVAVGLLLGRWRVAGVSLGTAWILFVGIAAAHFGLTVEHTTLEFVREFGLVLFVFSLGLQVGPGFMTALKQGGLILNLLAVGTVLLGILCTVVLFFTTGLPGSTLVGIMSGAVTNTPGLGAAQEAHRMLTGEPDPSIASGYAIAYPLAVLGIIGSILAVRVIAHIDVEADEKRLLEEAREQMESAQRFAIVVKNPAVFGKTMMELRELTPAHFVASRIWKATTGATELSGDDTLIEENDELLIVTKRSNRKLLTTLIGPRIQSEQRLWKEGRIHYEPRQVVVSQSKLNGVRLGKLALRSEKGVHVTRVHRAGADLVAVPGLRLVLGDRLTMVGTKEDLDRTERMLGNSRRSLDAPNLIVVFLGMVLGVVVGMVPFDVPGIPAPVKLGLAGGPLVVAILLGRFGPRLRLITYSTVSANLMLRELGMALFLAGVGLSAGKTFVATVVDGGWKWIGYGIVITVVPVLVIALVGHFWLRINYLTLAGVIAGATTDPPALAYAESLSSHGSPAIGYATVYPLTMFLRVVAAQVLILVLV